MSIHARLTKLETFPDAVVDPKGARGAGPITDGYYVLGHYTHLPVKGEPFMMTRYQSNDVAVLGLFTTSPVTGVTHHEDHITFTTLNSTYKLEPINDEQT